VAVVTRTDDVETLEIPRDVSGGRVLAGSRACTSGRSCTPSVVAVADVELPDTHAAILAMAALVLVFRHRPQWSYVRHRMACRCGRELPCYNVTIP
jgi:hypothetical protein